MNAALLLLPLLAPQDPVALDRYAPVRATLDRGVEDGSYSGVVAALEVDGERVLTHAAGGLEPDAIFRIFSMTKPVTAVAALMLVEEEKLELDAPVASVLPEFEDVQVATVEREGLRREVEQEPCERPMTVRDLLRHTSGLTYGFFGSSHVDRLVNEADLYSGDLATFTARLAELPLKHQPGERFEYSLSSDVLGRVVEVVSGQPLDEFFEARIFAPLGMEDTGFQVDEEDLARLAPIHGRAGGKLVETEAGVNLGMPAPTERPELLLGGAGLYSTADDYLRFCRMLVNGGALDGKRLLEEATVDEMLRDQLGERPSSVLLMGSSFGLGLAVTRLGNPRAGPPAGTAWWGGAAGTAFWVDREHKVAGVFMIQNWMELMHWGKFQAATYRALR